MQTSPAFSKTCAIPNTAAIRESKGITLEQIASATRISPAYLEAIERSEFERLPGGVYDISYIRQYARAVGYDEWELLSWYQVSRRPPEEPPPCPPERGWAKFTRLMLPFLRLVSAKKA